MDKLATLTRHIDHVLSNCALLGERLIERGETELGRKLIANGYIHDHSKFSGVEWEYLNEETREKHNDLFQYAARHHVSINMHHPEYWLSIHDMPRIYVAEMVADWAARSQEFGNDLREWITTKAYGKFNFTKNSTVGKEVREFVNLLLDKPFK